MGTIEAAGRADPREVYRRRLDDRRATRARLGRHEGTVANVRVALFAAAVGVGWLANGQRAGWGWIVVPITGFVGLVVAHSRLKRQIRRAERAVAYYGRGLDRVEDRWTGRGEDGARFADETHPFAADLDLFGRGSLFQRINAARTLAGESTLAAWLKAPQATAEVIRDRQAAVADLAARLDLREELDSLGDDVRDGLAAEALVAWGETPAILPHRRLRLVALALATVAVPAFAAWAFGLAVAGGMAPALVFAGETFEGTGPSPFLVAALLELGFWASIRARIGRALGPVDRRAAELELLAGLLRRLEIEEFASPALRAILGDGLSVVGEPPSKQIARQARLVRRIDSLRNPMVGPFAALTMAGTRLAFDVEAWRVRSGPAIAGWIDAVGRVEAFASLGAYAFENPEDVYAKVAADGPLFDAEAARPPADPARERRAVELGPARRRPPRPRRERVEHVGQEHDAPDRRRQRRARDGRRPGAGGPVAALAAPSRGDAPRPGTSLQAGASRFYAELTKAPPGRRPGWRASRRSCSCSTRSSTGRTWTTAASAPWGSPAA